MKRELFSVVYSSGTRQSDDSSVSLCLESWITNTFDYLCYGSGNVFCCHANGDEGGCPSEGAVAARGRRVGSCHATEDTERRDK